MERTLNKTNLEYRLLQGFLLWVGIYHLLLGLVGIFAKDLAVSFVRWFFNFNLTITPEVNWIINPFAAYVLIFGVFLVVAATNPVRYRNMVFVAVGLIAVRVIQRITFFIASPEGLVTSVDPVRNALAILVVAAFGAAMLILALKAK